MTLDDLLMEVGQVYNGFDVVIEVDGVRCPTKSARFDVDGRCIVISGDEERI